MTHRHLQWDDPELQAAQDRGCAIFPHPETRYADDPDEIPFTWEREDFHADI